MSVNLIVQCFICKSIISWLWSWLTLNQLVSLSIVDHWSRVGSESVSPGIRFLLSRDGSSSGGFGISVGLEDRISKVVVVESISVWVSSVLNKTIWVSNWTSVIGPSVSPSVGSLLLINSSYSSSLSISMGVKD